MRDRRVRPKQYQIRPVLADQQNTLDGLVTNIFGALDRAAGLIAVMHDRGEIATPKGTLSRGSVWVEQELAIVAFIHHVLRRHIEVALYISARHRA